jgi:hypothetical protein
VKGSVAKLQVVFQLFTITLAVAVVAVRLAGRTVSVRAVTV